MPAEELAEWQAYYELEPWGEERADLRSGMATAPLLNLLRRAWFKRGKEVRVSDFLMKFDREPQSADSIAQVFRAAAASSNRYFAEEEKRKQRQADARERAAKVVEEAQKLRKGGKR